MGFYCVFAVVQLKFVLKVKAMWQITWAIQSMLQWFIKSTVLTYREVYIVFNEGVTEKSLIYHRILKFISQQIIFKILKDYFCWVGIVYVLFKDYSTLYIIVYRICDNVVAVAAGRSLATKILIIFVYLYILNRFHFSCLPSLSSVCD